MLDLNTQLAELLGKLWELAPEQQHFNLFAPRAGSHSPEHLEQSRSAAVTHDEVRVLRLHSTGHEHKRDVANFEATSPQ